VAVEESVGAGRPAPVFLADAKTGDYVLRACPAPGPGGTAVVRVELVRVGGGVADIRIGSGQWYDRRGKPVRRSTPGRLIDPTPGHLAAWEFSRRMADEEAAKAAEREVQEAALRRRAVAWLRAAPAAEVERVTGTALGLDALLVIARVVRAEGKLPGG